MVEALAAHGEWKGGFFIIFGSYVAGTMRHDGDFDMLVDFPAERGGAVWLFIEAACAEWNIVPDIHDAATSRPIFVDRVRRQGRVLCGSR